MNITQIAIAKNEESNIEKCFGHLKNIVNKQILIDTGSTDKTIDIANKLGIEVYSIQWENDKDKNMLHKNFYKKWNEIGESK